MLKKFGRLDIAIILVLPVFMGILFAQSDTFIESEMMRVQEEFQTDKIQDNVFDDPKTEEQSLTQDALIRELSKPGNESLLEQIKQTGRLEIIDDINDGLEQKKTEEEKINELEQLEEAKKKEEEEEREKLRKARASLDGLLFEDNYAYFQSIKDFFGYEIFLKFDAKAKESGLLSNENYVIGPGDELVLSLWGDTEMQRFLRVNNEGTVYLKDLGIISVHGMKLSDLSARFKRILSKRYSTISPSNGSPSTFFDISLSKLKSISVFVNGEVIAPGSYNMNSYSTALDALQYAKGVSATGTLRNIIILRDGRHIGTLDIYDYLTTGKNSSDLNLKNGDVVFVGPRINTIQLEGEVLKPLKYELKENENLADLIKYSGGLLPNASTDRIKIERIQPFSERHNPIVPTKIFDTEYTEIMAGKLIVKPIKLENHDIVTVFQIPKLLTDYVMLSGAVYRKGRYGYTSDMTVGDLVKKAGGLLSDAFMERVELIRTNPNNSTEFISLNLNEPRYMDMKLNQRDSIHVYSEWNLKSKKIVIISGYISEPGFYFLDNNTRISDLILSKGGLEDEKHRNRTYLKRADLVRYCDDGLNTKIIPINLEKVLAGDKSEDLVLQDRDHLRIYGIGVLFTEPSVKITGYVNYEGDYSMSEKMTIEDLVMKAHGFREGAMKYKAVVFRLMKDREETDSLSQIIEVDIESDFLEKGYISDRSFFLKDKDHVVIRKHPDYEHIRKVTISGEVKFPGVYNLTHRQESFKEIIERAGGLTSEAFIEGTVLQRDSIKFQSDFKKALTSKKANIVMRHRDDIHIPKRPGKVEVKGFVYSPGTFTFREDWTLADYVEAAGGPVRDLEFMLGETVVYFPGGNAKVDGWWMSPNIAEGSTIVVEKVRRPEDSQWRAEIRQWLGIVTSTITILVLITRM